MSSSPFSAFPIFSGKEIVIYSGISILFLGIIGEIFNVFVFLSLRTFRQNSCAFYLTILSIVNIGQLITGLLSRILINGFAIDWTSTSLFYCKFRAFIFQTCTLVSFTCTCLATIDQYFATSTRPHWQQLATIRVAHRWIITTLSFWSLHGIPSIVFYDHLKIPGTDFSYCTSVNKIYMIYHSYIFLLIFNGILPVMITVIFGCLAYRNVRSMTYRAVPLIRRELDKQLTVMVLIQVFLNFFTVLPFLIVNTIATNTSIGSDRKILVRIQTIGSVCLCLYYLSFAVRKKSIEDFVQNESFFSISFRIHFTFTFVFRNDFDVNFYTFSFEFVRIVTFVEKRSVIKYFLKINLDDVKFYSSFQ